MMIATPKAFICGIAGTTLSQEEHAFLSEHQPYGVILFARNCESPAQLKALNANIKACLKHPYAQILIDQEGGRVARMKPPHWRRYPSAQFFADQGQGERVVDMVSLNAQILAQELAAHGITMDCAPVADLRFEQTHDVIGDRAFGDSVEQVVALASAQADGLLRAGVLPIIKHIPGHGRAMADSHLELPVVDASLKELEQTDFAVFKQLTHLPLAMTAHIVYTALDDALPATISAKAMRYIREEIGYDGLIMSDDVSMKALQGSMDTLSDQILSVGCDLVLHCNGEMDEMQLVANKVPAMFEVALNRANKAQAMLPSQPEKTTDQQFAAWQEAVAGKLAS